MGDGGVKHGLATAVNRFVYDLREFGDSYEVSERVTETFLEPRQYYPGPGDDLTFADRKWIASHGAGVQIVRSGVGVAFIWHDDRSRFEQARSIAKLSVILRL